MALALGKVTVLLGAGIAGSVLAQEGRLPNLSDLFSDVFKMVWKIGQGDSNPAVKSRNNSLVDQVNILRQELQSMAPNTPVIVMHTNSSGTNKFGVVVVVVMVGCGYAWWKGWKLPDMMFATKRGLTDACLTVSKQLEDVYTSISAGNIEDAEMRRTFNMGIGMVLVVSPEAAHSILGDKTNKSYRIGEVVSGHGVTYQS